MIRSFIAATAFVLALATVFALTGLYLSAVTP